MPFLRVMRDKRGYETTLLMHWFREGTRHRSRILYVFRTPGGVRVGRTPLDREVIQRIEQEHPDITFDWTAVRETQQVIEPGPEIRRRRPRREEVDGTAPADVPAAAAEPTPPAPTPVSPAAAVPRHPIPSALEGETPDEQIAFLNRWYPEIRDRLALRTADPERRDALLALAERLNPAAWTDADQITAGLPAAAEALERLARVMARRRRRARRAGGDRTGSTVGEDGGPAPTDS